MIPKPSTWQEARSRAGTILAQALALLAFGVVVGTVLGVLARFAVALLVGA